MDNTNILVITQGSLAYNSLFFGTGSSEVISTALAGAQGSWNSDTSQSSAPSWPWNARSEQANSSASAGIFVFNRHTAAGGASAATSHRTILLGY
ncbi:hypothetical protein FWG76_02040 [Candidatus Saccharibacteria bacterium]|nr:hypothetical protein [Candidatus Saccharibacteria bacterium]